MGAPLNNKNAVGPHRPFSRGGSKSNKKPKNSALRTAGHVALAVAGAVVAHKVIGVVATQALKLHPAGRVAATLGEAAYQAGVLGKLGKFAAHAADKGSRNLKLRGKLTGLRRNLSRRMRNASARRKRYT